ncbi:hypothetical protein [Bacillus sp. FJAT-22090]|uniref:hypothetical protein n=1 Tax=Bacillus sp. FJAT-22090 TaxID=1581038 RepID=UPI00119FC50C|nr:hypothetical protein [Bacillus sp. FJAT-22090]
MSKGWLVLLIGVSALFMLPYQAQGEELNNEKRGYLSDSITRLMENTETVTEGVHSTLNNTIPAEALGDVFNVVEPAVGIVIEVEEQTNTVVENAVKELPPTTEFIVSEVTSILEETIESVPEVPIVTPVLTEVNNSVKKVTNKVQETVEEGTGTVLTVIDQEDVPLPHQELIITGSTKKLKEPRKTDKTPLVEKSEEVVQEATIEPALSEEIVEEEIVKGVKESPQINLLKVEKDLANTEQEVVKVLQVKQEYKAIEKANKKEIIKTTKIPTILPPIPEKQKKNVIVTPIVTTSTSSPSSSSSSVMVQSGDSLFALLPSQEPMKELIRKKWYHKNHYAIIQWIHTPLRKPPENTPFYT